MGGKKLDIISFERNMLFRSLEIISFEQFRSLEICSFRGNEICYVMYMLYVYICVYLYVYMTFHDNDTNMLWQNML